LHYACLKGNQRTAEVLISRGAKVRKKERKKRKEKKEMKI